MRTLLAAILMLLALPAAARAIVGDHDVSANSAGDVAIAWIEHEGELTTLNFFRDGYTGELARFWHDLVDPLPEAARVLDLATGNGAVALVVRERVAAVGHGDSLGARAG